MDEQIKKLLNKQKSKRKFWSKKELELLKELKSAGIFVSTIMDDRKFYNKNFSGRSYHALNSKYAEL